MAAPNDAPRGRTARLRLLLLAVLVIAGGVRGANLAQVLAMPSFEHLVVDARGYHEQAIEISGGRYLGHGVFYQDPLYPYFIAAVYRVSGREPRAVTVVQSLLGLLLVGLTSALAYRLGGGGAAIIAGLLAAVYRPFIFYESMLLKSSISALLVTAAFWAVFAARRSLALIAFGGLLLGLALLTQAQIWLLLPVLLAAAHARRGTRGAIVLAVATSLALFPVALRNRIAGGEWVLVTSQMGQNFYTGNGPHVVDGRFRSPEFVRANPAFEEGDYRAKAEELTGRKLSAREVSRYWLRRGLEHAIAEPGQFSRNLVRKFGEIVNAYEVPDNVNLGFERTRNWVLAMPLASYGLVAPLALAVALFALRRPRSDLGLVAAACLVYHAGVAIFFVFSRYRLPIVPLLITLASVGVVRGAAAVEAYWSSAPDVRPARAGRRALAGLVVVAVMTIVVHRPVLPVGLAQARINRAKAYAEEAARRRRLDTEPAIVNDYLRIARDEFTTAAAEAPTWAEPQILLSVLEATAGHEAAALTALQRALEAEPDNIEGLVILSRMRNRRGEQAEAERLWRRAQAIDAEQAAGVLRSLLQRN